MLTDCRATICVSAHYVRDRVRFLAIVLGEIAKWPVRTVDVILISNTAALADEEVVVQLARDFSKKGWSLRTELAGPLPHPYHLTWVHKTFITKWLSQAQSKDDFFIYIEDDMVLTADNFSYFYHFLPQLGPRRLIPGFLRFEIVSGVRYSVDFVEPQPILLHKNVTLGKYVFINPTNPYWAGFILDKDLATEHVGADSFDLDRSALRSTWQVRERAAMGLTWEDPPHGFRSRYVVPLLGDAPFEACLVWHCAQNYTSARQARFGSVPVQNMFTRYGLRSYRSRAGGKIKRAIAKFNKSSEGS